MRTSIIAACTTYALASRLRAYWVETRADVTQHTFGSGSDDANSAGFGAVMVQSGYAADRIMPIMLDSINGTNNESNRPRRLADPKFTGLVDLNREGQLAGAIQIRIERPKGGGESSVLIFGLSKDPQLAENGRK